MWVVECASGTATISFSDFSTELNFDYVYVYDGDSNADSQLARLHGNAIPDDVTSTGTTMYVALDTD
eukprot:COSAG06_NODE_20776_length_782_cov_0.710102_2_plen_66_part_01